MIEDPNLLATSEIWRESEACSELWMLLRAVGDETPVVDRTRVRGIISAQTGLAPIEAIRRLRVELQGNPEGFRVLLRIIPIQATVPTEIEAMVKKTMEMATRIGEKESFRITLEKRMTDLRSREVIDAVAKDINRKVDLENPDWIVLVEIVGKVTGLSVIPADGILNIQKERPWLTTES
jgi:tRNA acetyltransferase TAN1